MVNAYIIGHVTVKDQDKWSEYRNKVPSTLKPWGGELVFRGELASVLSGNHKHSDTVVIRFPDLQCLTGWYSSSQYQSLISLRQEAAEIDLLAYEE
jgi:uncharacterized protein (DUF1330 family)